MTPDDLQRLFGNLPGMYLVLRADEAFTIVAASQDYFAATGTGGSILGRPCFEVFPDNPAAPGPRASEKLAQSFRQVIRTGQPHAMEPLRYDLRGADGAFQERYWAPVNSPVAGADGRVAYIVQHTEDATAKANRNAIQILESITEGFFTLDRQWRFDYVNSAAYRILGQPMGALSGRVLWQVYPGLEDTEFGRTYRHTMDRRETGSFTAYYPGNERWYEVTTFPAPEGISVYFRDITQQRAGEARREQLEREAEQQRRIYEAALNNTPDFAYIFALDHRFLYANESLRRMWGLDGEARGKTLAELGYEPWHVAMHDREIEEVIRTREPIRGVVPFTGTDGRRIYDYIFAPVLGEDGSVVAVAGTTRDMTEQHAAQEALQDQAARLTEADRAKDDFLATLSHELRNPLAPLRTSVALLRRSRGDPAVADRVQDIMERQIGHLVRLVDDLLEVSRVSRGTLVLQREAVDAALVVRNALEVNDAAVAEARHQVVVELPPAPLWLDGDPVRLTQIVSNLVHNAAIYSEPGGRIHVRVTLEGDTGVLAVQDNGPGIAPEVLPRMFEMFSRGDRASGRAQGGLGIGLALARRLAQLHGGSLDATSEGPGRGSTFSVRLPLARQAPAHPTAEGEPADDAELAGAHVLVVDDNEDARGTLAMVLEALGATVRVAADGPQALDLFSVAAPDVVLLDIGMPGMDGLRVARELRRLHPEHRAALVALTGWGQEEDRRRVREAGIGHHLVKPVDLDLLGQVVRGAMGGAGAEATGP